MGIIEKIFAVLGYKKNKKTDNSIYLEKETETYTKEKQELFDELHSIWEYIRFRENTQAFFISQIVGFEEWVSMEEIIRRIEEVFGIKFKNSRSLYPYIKTLVDLNLMEAISAGGKMKWRKKEVLINLSEKEKEKEKKKLAEKRRAGN
ncbi:MAG: hypothetical protein ABIA76_04825 [Candidatus Diapherotrites archaeon]